MSLLDAESYEIPSSPGGDTGPRDPDALGNYLRNLRGLEVLGREETNEMASA